MKYLRFKGGRFLFFCVIAYHSSPVIYFKAGMLEDSSRTKNVLFIISWSPFRFLSVWGTKKRSGESGNIALPSSFHGLSFPPGSMGKGQFSKWESPLGSQKWAHKVEGISYDFAGVHLWCRMRNILCPIATRAAIFFLKRKKPGSDERI